MNANNKLLKLEKELRGRCFFTEAAQVSSLIKKRAQQETNAMGQTVEQATGTASRNLDEAISGFMVTLNGITGSQEATQQLLAHVQEATDGPIFGALMKAVASEDSNRSIKKEANVPSSAKWVAKVVANTGKLKQQGEAVYSALYSLLNQKYPDQRGGQTSAWTSVAMDEINQAINRNPNVPAEAGATVKAMIQRFLSQGPPA